MPKVITTKELQEKLNSDEDLVLIDVLSSESYQKRHLPTAKNIPFGPDFVDKVKDLGVNKNNEVVAYCSSSTCGASPAAAKALEGAGFSNVYHYKDGLAGWSEAGIDFEA